MADLDVDWIEHFGKRSLIRLRNVLPMLFFTL